MKRSLRAALALALAGSMPMAALAAPHGGGGGGSHPAPAARPAPVSRPAAPPARPAPVSRPVQPGFSFPHDTGARPPVYPAHPVAPPAGHPMPPRSVRAPGHPIYRPPQPLPHSYHGPVVNNPHHWGGWGWNHGRAWYPAPIYWGGGFWGPYALGALTGALLLGSIIDYQDQMIYPSYQVQPLTPGAQLLQNYGLTQTPCGPPNLVVIWGPGDSVICAYPNNLVSAGNYQIDPTTLSLVSAPTQPPQ